jgi:hypothetical protein
MSDVNAEGATNAPQDASMTPETPANTGAQDTAGTDSGNGAAAGGSVEPVIPAGGSNGPAAEGNDAGGASGDEQSQGGTSAGDASGSNAGDAGNGAGGAEQPPSGSDASAPTSSGTDPNGSAGADPANPSAGPSADSDANASDGESLVAKVESLALAAFNAGRTEEHNLMAWLHTHLTGAQKIAQGADQLNLSDEGRAAVEKVKALL